MDKFLLKRPIAVFLLTATLCSLGALLLFDMPVKLYPNTKKTRIMVTIPHSSIGAESFEENYGEVIQAAIDGIEGVEESEVVFNNGSSFARIYFDWGFPAEEGKALVNASLAQISSRLPEEARDYGVGYWGGHTAGFYAMAAYSEEIPSKEVYRLMKTYVEPELNKIKNVSIARINAVEELHVDITLDPVQTLKLNLMPDEIASAIQKGYRDIPVGNISSRSSSFSVKIDLNITRLEDLKNIIIKMNGDNPIYLKDVADVSIYNGLPRRLYSVNGKRAIVLFAMPDDNGNIRDLALSINTILEDVRSKLPPHIKFQKLIDPGDYINSAILNVVKAGLIGGALAILITFVFLGELRNTIIIAISLPLTVLLSFTLLRNFGITINLISLGGLTLAVGMIVDAAIVVIENIYRHRQHAQNQGSSFELVSVIADAVKEVRPAIIASTLTSIVVFLPIKYTSGLTAAILGDLSMAVILVLTTSTLVALLIIPSIGYSIFKRVSKDRKKDSKGSVQFVEKLVAGYSILLRRLLHSNFQTALVILVPIVLLCTLVVFVVPQITKEVMAKPESARVTLRMQNTLNKDKEKMLELIKPIEARILKDYDNVLKSLFTRVSRSNSGSMTLTLKSTKIRSQVIQRLQGDFTSEGNWRFQIHKWDPAELPLPRTDDLHVTFSGPSDSQVLTYLKKAQSLLNESKTYGNVETVPSVDPIDSLNLKPRYHVIQNFKNTNLSSLRSATRVALNGRNVVRMAHQDDMLDVDVSYEQDFINSPRKLERFLVNTEEGPLPLGHFFDFSSSPAITEVQYNDGEKTYNLYAKLKEGTAKNQRKALEEKVAQIFSEKMALAPGYTFKFEETQTVINEATQSLLTALAMSIGLIFIILGIQFNSLTAPLSIMAAVPLGLIGVIAALFIFDSSISLNSLLGMILLGGVAVNNSILIYDFYQKYRFNYADDIEALVAACQLRLRPILITTLTTILGMLPIAFALGDGTNVIQPLGIAVAGGLGVSTLSTIFVVPALLKLMTRKRVAT